jgi:TonB family protein
MTVLRISIHADGSAPQSKILTSSGSAALDAAAVGAVVAAQPLPPPPKGLLNDGSLAPVDLGFRVMRKGDPTPAPEDDRFAVISADIEPKTSGTINPIAVQKAVETYQPDVAGCVDRNQAPGSELIGQATIEFEIAESGNIQHPIIVNTRGLTRQLEGCMLVAMRLWTMPKPTGGPVKVAFPFRFGIGQAYGATTISRSRMGEQH